MADTPDLSKVISLIMQNPELVSQISSLLSQDTDGKKSEPNEEAVSETSAVTEAPSPTRENTPRQHRQELLHAMKPYLSENRRAAIDSMVSISGILDMMRKNK